MERDDHLQVDQLLHEIQRLEDRDLQLWYANILVGLALAAGFVFLGLPSILWHSEAMHLEGRYLPQFLFGLIPLIILFNVYVIDQRRTLRRAREVLARQLLRAETAEHLLLVDPLTEVFNRRYLERVMPKEVGRCDRLESTLTFILVDLDDFKSVNTRFGHLVGDRVIKEAATVLRRTIRVSDTVVRFGGDEFLVLLPDSDERYVDHAIGRLREAVVRWNLTNVVPGYQMSLSCGAATYHKGEDVQAVVKCADERMYADKARPRSAI